MGANAASQPFNIPVAPVAGFTPDQTAAFQGVRNAQGMANPYFASAVDYTNRAATPINAADVNNYYNPYAQNVFAAQDALFGKQMRQTTGQLTQAAGGVGADRIAVGQAELARQQQLARGELSANMWQQALNAAQQQRGREAQAGFAMASFGPAALNASLYGNNALLSAGQQQQAQEQRVLDAPYQNELQRIAYPFQTAQYLAGLTGSMNPVLGGTTRGETITQQPKPSIWSQIGGAAMAGLGLYMGNPGMVMGGLGGASGKGSSPGLGGNPNQSMAGYDQSGNFYNYSWRGGRVPAYADGGPVFNPTATDVINTRFPFAGDINAGADFMRDPVGFRAALQRHGRQLPQQPAPLPPPFAPIETERLEQPYGPVETPPNAAPTAGPSPAWPPPPGAQPPADPTAGLMPPMPQDQLPYPGTTQPDAGSAFARSPWAALVQAGLATMASTSPYAGINLGKGALEGMKLLQEQRKQVREEETINQRARSLWQDAQKHLDTYRAPTADQKARLTQADRHHEDKFTRMTEAERIAEERLQQQARYQNALIEKQMEELRLKGLQPVKMGTDPRTYLDVYGVRGPDGILRRIDPQTGNTLEPGDPMSSTAPGGGFAMMSPEALTAAAERYLQSGTMPPNVGRGTQGPAMIAAIQNRAAQLAEERGIDPQTLPAQWQNFKAQQVAKQRFFSGPQGNTIRSLNVVVDHAATAKDLAAALKNNDIRVFNQLAQRWAEETGSPAPTNFDTAKRIVGAEIIKALGVAGAGTEVERREAADAFNRARSPEQLMGAITVVQRLLGGQLSGLRLQFTKSTGLPEKDFNDMLLPETLKFLSGEKVEKPDTPTSDKPPPRPASVPRGSAYNATRKQWRTPDGVILDANGKPVQN